MKKADKVFDKNSNLRTKNERLMKSAQGTGPIDRRKRSRILDAEVGQSIRLHRKNAKMTLQGLADRLGIAYQQVQKYETGVNRVGAGRLMEIAEILNIPVASFFESPRGRVEDAATAAGTTPDSETGMQGRQLLVSFLRIKDPQKRRAALAFIRSLAEPD
jgi:transcriptional regulator with XRE-family HTH domain